MSILEGIAAEVRCPSCGKSYRLSLAVIAASHRALHEGCPMGGESVRECPQVSWAALLDEGALEGLELALDRVAGSLEVSGAKLVLASDPSLADVEPAGEKAIDEALEESFPASDAPFWSP